MTARQWHAGSPGTDQSDELDSGARYLMFTAPHSLSLRMPHRDTAPRPSNNSSRISVRVSIQILYEDLVDN
jgi:hypothetical protein